MAELIRNVDHDRFAVREEALHTLAQLADDVVMLALEKALAADPTLEMKRRIEKLIRHINIAVPSVERLRLFRAIEVLPHHLRVAVRSEETPPGLLAAADRIVDGPNGALAFLRSLLD